MSRATSSGGRGTSEGPGLGDGLRARVGVRHVPLAELIAAFLSAGFALEAMEEPGSEDYPRLLALAAGRAPHGRNCSADQ